MIRSTLHTIRRRRRLLPVVLLVVTACGGGGGGAATDSALTVAMNEFAFEPSRWSVAAGTDVTVTASNTGSIRHEWVVLQEGVRLDDEADKPDDEAVFQRDFVFFQLDAEPGAEQTATFAVPANPGTYQVVCAIPGHLGAGMVGELRVLGS